MTEEEKCAEYVRTVRNLPKRDLYDQLAEECCELAQAVHKYVRASGMSPNPTPVSIERARANLEEEVEDVLLCMWVLDLIPADGIRYNKLARWAGRIEKAFGRKADE